MTDMTCVRCGLSIRPRSDRPAWERCSRCLARDRITVPMTVSMSAIGSARHEAGSAPDGSTGLVADRPVNRLMIDRRPVEGGWILVLSGELGLRDSAALEAAVRERERADPGRVVLDLRELSRMDSTGLAVVVAADLRARQVGRRLELVCSAGGQVGRLFELSGVDRELDLSESTAAAGSDRHAGAAA